MWAKHKQQAGFTIVELLIVIVVIGILAAITIVAYNGVQDRARFASAQAYENQLIKANYTKIVGWWKFDECTGTTAGDSSELQAAAAFSGSPSFSPDTPTNSGCAMYFSGTPFLTTATNIGVNGYTKAAWVKIPACTNANNIIADRPTTGSAGTAFWAPTPNCKLSAGHNNAWATVQDTVSLADNKWHYVSVTYDPTTGGGSLKLYKDGSLVSSATSVAVPASTMDGVAIGSHGGGSQIKGYIDNPLVIAP